jgi:hypothetical protein
VADVTNRRIVYFEGGDGTTKYLPIDIGASDTITGFVAQIMRSAFVRVVSAAECQVREYSLNAERLGVVVAIAPCTGDGMLAFGPNGVGELPALDYDKPSFDIRAVFPPPTTGSAPSPSPSFTAIENVKDDRGHDGRALAFDWAGHRWAVTFNFEAELHVPPLQFGDDLVLVTEHSTAQGTSAAVVVRLHRDGRHGVGAVDTVGATSLDIEGLRVLAQRADGMVLTTYPLPDLFGSSATATTNDVVVVPNIYGTSVTSAEELLIAAGLRLGTVDGPLDRPVIDADPKPGTVVRRGTIVNVRTG